MDVRRLHAFAKVFELRSFSRAGDELRLSQPTISAHFSALEDELDTQLFEVLRRFKWNSFNNEVADWGGDQVDHGDEIGHIPVASGSGASCLKETV